MKRFFPLLLAVVLSDCCAFGWNGTGHMTVAYIAYQKLTPTERTALVAILARHGDHDRWVKGIPTTNTELMQLATFVHAAAWPDDIRSDKRFYDDTAKHSVPTPIPVGFPDVTLVPEGTNKIHKNWHFINEPLAGDDLDKLAPFDDQGKFRTAPTILSKIADAESALRNADPSVRAYYLPWLLHLTGDVHQPLHTVAHLIGRSASGQPIGDLGGNSVKIVPFHNATMPRPVENLHSFWDDSLGQATDLTTIRSLGDSLMQFHPSDSASSEMKPDAWFAESAKSAIAVVYKDLADAQEDADGLMTIPDGYFDTANALSGQRVAQAGYRLAAVLKAILSASGGH